MLALWEGTAGPEHPMVALTLDKMVTFYSEQKRFEDAEPLAERATRLRARALVSSYRAQAALASQQAKMKPALELLKMADTVWQNAGLPKPAQKILPAPKDARPVSK